MTAGAMICFVIYLLVALIMIGIGFVQIKSSTPVGFYSGEKPPRPEELTDVILWNKKHGAMWVLYGFLILLSYFSGAVILDSVWCIIPLCGVPIIAILFMIRYHNKLKRDFMR